MLLKRTGFPPEDSFVLCTVTNIHYHSVFAKLDEYENKTGLIHISEISPGRIRNIRDYVVEGKKIVCKVLRIDRSKGHIDLSLRRVNDNQKRVKINEIKQEQKAEKIIEQVAKSKKKDAIALYKELTEIIFKKYDDLTACFKEAARKETLLEDLGIDKGIAKEIQPIVAVRFKEEDVVIGGKLSLSTVKPDGIELVKKTLTDAQKVDKNVSITYAGGGSYNISVQSHNYKSAEKILNKVLDKALSITKSPENTGEFKRKE